MLVLTIVILVLVFALCRLASIVLVALRPALSHSHHIGLQFDLPGPRRPLGRRRPRASHRVDDADDERESKADANADRTKEEK